MFNNDKFEKHCKKFFDSMSNDHQDFVVVFDPYPIGRYYLIDSYEKEVVKITDEKMIELINSLCISSINLEEEHWLLNKEKSRYTFFETLEERKEFEKEKEIIFDTEYSTIKI